MLALVVDLLLPLDILANAHRELRRDVVHLQVTLRAVDLPLLLHPYRLDAVQHRRQPPDEHCQHDHRAHQVPNDERALYQTQRREVVEVALELSRSEVKRHNVVHGEDVHIRALPSPLVVARLLADPIPCAAGDVHPEEDREEVHRGADDLDGRGRVDPLEGARQQLVELGDAEEPKEPGNAQRPHRASPGCVHADLSIRKLHHGPT
mmetsp:Transcript_122598/g.354336  ORF Transcript_122598/g.354336 Transcript_122598/m.354336 type:complete len:207 (+) Transcript_122598:638-1258(+)